MNKIEELLKTLNWRNPLTDDELEIAFNAGMFDKGKAIGAMQMFGKICFDAGRKGYDFFEIQKNPGLYAKHYYKTYEDFLKEIEDETGN